MIQIPELIYSGGVTSRIYTFPERTNKYRYIALSEDLYYYIIYYTIRTETELCKPYCATAIIVEYL